MEQVAFLCSIERLGTMYMPLEVPLGELAVAPVNPVHEELVRKEFGSRRLFRPFVGRNKKLILLPLRLFPSPVYFKQNRNSDNRRALQPRRGAPLDR